MRSFRQEARGATVPHRGAPASRGSTPAPTAMVVETQLPSPYPPSAMNTPAATSGATSLPSAGDYLPSISPSVVYSTAHALWTPQELQLLHHGLDEYPADAYDNVTRYIKIAAAIPGKGVRDVAFKVKSMSAMTTVKSPGRELYAKRMRMEPATTQLDINESPSQPLDEAQMTVMFQENVLAINTIRTNLLNGKGSENREYMLKFRDNCHTLMAAIGDICNTIPPLPVKLDTSLIGGSTPSPRRL